eukprot:jgi/Tetstr1/449341/TSEL_003855.t1
MAAEREFATRRRNALHELYDLDGDRSRKGSVDAPIQDLVDLINAHPHMFTTSSCSGRISCFAEPTPETRAAGLKGGEWVYASHDKADADEVVSKVTAAAAKAGCLVFRMEPFVMHVEARGVEWSALLLGWARQAGFRESGMVPSLKGRCMVGIRCNLRLEVPLADEGNLLVGEAYIRYLVNMANAKFDANADRHARFLEVLRGMPQELEHSAARNGAAGRVKAHPHPPAVEASSAIRPRQGRGRRGRGRGGAGKHASLPPGSAPASGGAGTREQALAERQLALLSRLAAVEERVARAELPGAVLRTEPLLRCLPFRCPTARPTGGERRDARGGHRQQRRRGARASAELTPQELGRWGLSATHLPGLPGKVVVFGGFGGTAAHRRHADVLLADLVEGTLSRPPVDAGLSHPCARCYHAALPIGAHRLLVVGGRVGPSAPLGDAWLLDARSWAWSPLEGAALPPRFRHAAAVTPASKEHPTQQVVVFGGCSGEGELLGDAWLLDASAPWRWQPLQLGGTPPGPRHSAAAAATADGRVFIYGGLASRAPHGLDDLHCLARQPDGAWLSTRVALPAEGPATWPPPAFSATLTALPAPSGGCRLVMLGGCSTLNHTATYVLDTASCAWRKQPLAVHEPRSYAPVRHACCYVPAVPGLCEGSAGLLCVVGGGAVCFAFGTIQGALHCVEVAPFVGGSAGTAVTAPPGKQQRRGRKSGRKENPAVAASEPQGWVLALPKQHAKQMKDALKAARWLDQARRGGELAAGEVGLPLTAAAAEALLGGGDTGVAGRLLELSGGEVRRQAMSAAQRVQSPARRLREAMSSLLSRHGASLPANEHAALLDALPVKWERLGELVLLPAGAFQGAAWAAVPASELWPAVAEALQTRKLARQAPVASTGTRSSWCSWAVVA